MLDYHNTNAQKMKEEVWKGIKSEEGNTEFKYEISNYGRVKSHAYGKERILKVANVEGYKAVRLRMKNGQVQNKYVHRLVAEYFVEKKTKNQNLVIHLDYDKKNNNADNLRWATQNEQVEHKIKGPHHKKGLVTNAKLDSSQVAQIKRLLNEGNLRKSVIARKFLITHTQLNRIENGTNWKNVQPDAG